MMTRIETGIQERIDTMLTSLPTIPQAGQQFLTNKTFRTKPVIAGDSIDSHRATARYVPSTHSVSLDRDPRQPRDAACVVSAIVVDRRFSHPVKQYPVDYAYHVEASPLNAWTLGLWTLEKVRTLPTPDHQ
jgi:hypothetical protein